MSRWKEAYDHNNMVPAKAGETTPQVIWKTDDGILIAWGTTVPTDATAGYAPGCKFFDVNASAGAVEYVNEGTATSCDFNLVITPSNLNAQVDLVFPVSGTAAGRGPSPLIWDTCPMLDYILDPTDGYVYFNDFLGEYVLAANQTATHLDNGVSGFTGATAGSTISMLTDEPTGVCCLSTTTANESVGVSALGGLNTAAQFKFSSGKKAWFEARLKVNSVTDAVAGVFIGFAEEALLAEDGVLADAGTLNDKDYIGFHRLEADGDKFDIVYNTSGGGGAVDHKTDAVTLVADTYKKIGMYCDGTSIYFYDDGVLVSGATALALATAKVPDGEEMAFYLVLNGGDGNDATAEIDWVRIALEY